jgi:FkbM family methyltransferase
MILLSYTCIVLLLKGGCFSLLLVIRYWFHMKVRSFFYNLTAFGWEGFKLYVRLKFVRTTIQLPDWKQPVFIRPGTMDLPTFKQIFLRKEYEVPFDGQVKTILDLGANVGYAAVYFANRFPEATIIAVEPASDNFAQLLKNTKSYSTIHAVQSAVWSSGKSLKIVDLGQSWSYRVSEVPENTPGSFVAKSIPDLMDQFQLDHLDIVKIDVEGTECELFANHIDAWLPKTKMIIVEFHDWMFPGSSKQITELLTRRGFSVSTSGENHIFVSQN